MGAPDLTLSPGDILRGLVDHVDASLDACFIDAGAHGTLLVPLAGIPGTTVAKLVPGACVCAQVIAPRHGKKLARASVSIEFSGRASVLVLDGTSITGPRVPVQPSVFVSKRVASMRRAELATRVEASFSDESCGLPSMLGAVCGPVTVILRTAADTLPWDQVLSAIVVQVTEAAAFTVIARADTAPALLMAEKPDADGDASIAGPAGSDVAASNATALDGRRIVLACGGEVVFERTEAMWTVAVRPGSAADAAPERLVALVNGEAAVAASEAVEEYDVAGIIAVRFLPGMPFDCFNDLVDDISDRLSRSQTRISGDADVSVVLIERRGSKMTGCACAIS